MKRQKITRASYRTAIEWIAFNDEPNDIDIDTVSAQISVALIADIFIVPAEQVASNVIDLRIKHKFGKII